MIKPEQIPDEVVEAAHRAFYAEKPCGFREAIAIGLAAWPDVRHSIERNGSYPVLILPLPTEKSDDWV